MSIKYILQSLPLFHHHITNTNYKLKKTYYSRFIEYMGPNILNCYRLRFIGLRHSLSLPISLPYGHSQNDDCITNNYRIRRVRHRQYSNLINDVDKNNSVQMHWHDSAVNLHYAICFVRGACRSDIYMALYQTDNYLLYDLSRSTDQNYLPNNHCTIPDTTLLYLCIWVT